MPKKKPSPNFLEDPLGGDVKNEIYPDVDHLEADPAGITAFQREEVKDLHLDVQVMVPKQRPRPGRRKANKAKKTLVKRGRKV